MKVMYVHASFGKGMRTVCAQSGRPRANISPGATPHTFKTERVGDGESVEGKLLGA